MTPSSALRVDLARARAHWYRRAGLAAPLALPLPALVAATGWLRTLGGVDVYLAARARVPGMRRAELDAAVESAALRVVPAVRGCMYLVPAADVPLTLRVAAETWRPRTGRELDKVGSSWREVEDVATAVVAALRAGPASTDALRKEVPVRSYGEAGKKVGLSSPMPVALRLLELDDRIARAPEHGRLDAERYLWRLAPAETVRVPDDAIERWARLATAFFGHAGPATLASFAAWAGISQRDARSAIARADLVPVAVDGFAEDALLLAGQRSALAEADAGDAFALLSFEDNYLVCHGGPAPLVDPADRSIEIPIWDRPGTIALGDAGHLSSRAVVQGGRVVGFWELDAPARGTVLAPLRPLAPRAAARLRAQLADTAGFLLDELGHGRSFSIDTDDEVARRAAALASPSAPRPSVRAPTTPTGAKKKPAATAGKKKPAATVAKKKPAATAAKKKPARSRG